MRKFAEIKIFNQGMRRSDQKIGRIKRLMFALRSLITLCCILIIFMGGCVHLTNTGKKSGEGCSVCHASEKVLPNDHPSTKDLALGQCLECHESDVPMLTHKLPLSHTHQLQGIGCMDCHDQGNPQTAVGPDKCLSCHDFDKIIDKTSSLGAQSAVAEANPHNSHYGPSYSCDLCHHVHRKSEDFCAQCHEFNFLVPSPMAPLNLRNKG